MDLNFFDINIIEALQLLVLIVIAVQVGNIAKTIGDPGTNNPPKGTSGSGGRGIGGG